MFGRSGTTVGGVIVRHFFNCPLNIAVANIWIKNCDKIITFSTSTYHFNEQKKEDSSQGKDVYNVSPLCPPKGYRFKGEIPSLKCPPKYELPDGNKDKVEAAQAVAAGSSTTQPPPAAGPSSPQPPTTPPVAAPAPEKSNSGPAASKAPGPAGLSPQLDGITPVKKDGKTDSKETSKKEDSTCKDICKKKSNIFTKWLANRKAKKEIKKECKKKKKKEKKEKKKKKKEKDCKGKDKQGGAGQGAATETKSKSPPFPGPSKKGEEKKVPSAAIPPAAPPQSTPPTAAPPKSTPPTGEPPQCTPPKGASPQSTPTTAAPPQSTPPTAATPQSTPPTAAPPQSTPPTAAPPKSTPPTAAPPKSTPPTAAPPQSTPPTAAPPQSTTPAVAPPQCTPPTGAPPQSTPPTAAPPQSTPPTAAPPQSTPPTAAPPQSTPPTAAPPKSTPPTEAPPQSTPPTAAPPPAALPQAKPPPASSPPATASDKPCPQGQSGSKPPETVKTIAALSLIPYQRIHSTSTDLSSEEPNNSCKIPDSSDAKKEAKPDSAGDNSCPPSVAPIIEIPSGPSKATFTCPKPPSKHACPPIKIKLPPSVPSQKRSVERKSCITQLECQSNKEFKPEPSQSSEEVSGQITSPKALGEKDKKKLHSNSPDFKGFKPKEESTNKISPESCPEKPCSVLPWPFNYIQEKRQCRKARKEKCKKAKEKCEKEKKEKQDQGKDQGKDQEMKCQDKEAKMISKTEGLSWSYNMPESFTNFVLFGIVRHFHKSLKLKSNPPDCKDKEEYPTCPTDKCVFKKCEDKVCGKEVEEAMKELRAKARAESIKEPTVNFSLIPPNDWEKSNSTSITGNEKMPVTEKEYCQPIFLSRKLRKNKIC